MRVGGLWAVLALVGLTSAAPTKLAERGGNYCIAPANNGQSSSSSSITWWAPSDMSSVSSYWVESSETYSYGVVQCVVYVQKVPVPVPTVTTCTAIGTIVIENNITIDVTIVPTVITYTTASTATSTATTTVTSMTSQSASVAPTSRGRISSVPASSSATTPTPGPGPTPHPKSNWPSEKVVGYYGIGESKFMAPSAVPWQYLTHVCLAFGSVGDDYKLNISSEGMQVMRELFPLARAAGVKPILSIGGWGYGSAGYSAMVSSNYSRYTFVQSVKNWVAEYGVTGVDLDWEWPGRFSEEGVPYNPDTDIPNFLTLLSDLRNAFGKNITLSMAVSSSVPLVSDMSDFASYMDWFNMMFYDFAAGPMNYTGPDAPLYGGDSLADSIDGCVKIWEEANVPASKMVLGVPSYGRSFTLDDYMSPFEDGLYNPCNITRPAGDSDQSPGTGVWKWRNLLSQGVLVADPSLGDGMYVAGDGWNYRFDDETFSPYVWSNTTGEFIQYDDPVTISYKREYAYQAGMQGLMVWEIEYDDNAGTLLSYMK